MARKRARTEDGHFVKDDPTTPENEAWVDDEKPKKAKEKPTSAFTWYVSSDKETSVFDVQLNDDRFSGTWDAARQYVRWKIPTELKDAMGVHHFTWTGRIVEDKD